MNLVKIHIASFNTLYEASVKNVEFNNHIWNHEGKCIVPWNKEGRKTNAIDLANIIPISIQFTKD